MALLRELPYSLAELAHVVPWNDEFARCLEDGAVLFLPDLGFDLTRDEDRFLTSTWLAGSEKSVYLKGEQRQLRGSNARGQDLADLRHMIDRFGAQARRLIETLLPRYVPHLLLANTSFRPCEAAGRTQSWRHDDTRLHTDAFPSQPLQSKRILRVFTNVHPRGQPRVWRIGEPFPDMARRFLPQVRGPLPGQPWLLRVFGLTKSLRSEYDHIMLCLHDLQKANAAYQTNSPQMSFPFPSGSTWVCFSDQVLHAVMAGQFLFEQTFHLPIAAQVDPDLSPQRILERMTGRSLLPSLRRAG